MPFITVEAGIRRGTEYTTHCFIINTDFTITANFPAIDDSSTLFAAFHADEIFGIK